MLVKINPNSLATRQMRQSKTTFVGNTEIYFGSGASFNTNQPTGLHLFLVPTAPCGGENTLSTGLGANYNLETCQMLLNNTQVGWV